MSTNSPNVIVLAGPNGAGKSTIADVLLAGACQITEFVNADVIARGLSAYYPEGMALQAGRIMLLRLQDLADQRQSFAFETTLATRSFVSWLRELKQFGYRFRLVYVWLNSPELAIERVADRVSQGGHSIPPDVIRRRYERSLSNLFQLYLPLADDWEVLDNSTPAGIQLVASSFNAGKPTVLQPDVWKVICRQYGF